MFIALIRHDRVWRLVANNCGDLRLKGDSSIMVVLEHSHVKQELKIRGSLMQIPPLAGLCSYAEAAHPGFSVDENVERLLRYAWIEKRIMELGLYWMNPTPEWEVKEALSLHLYLAAEHVKWMRERISEMRNPPPRMDISPSESLTRFLDELLMAEDTLERLVALYGVLKPALLAAYREHYEAANPLIDHPTRRIVKSMLDDEMETSAWGKAALDAILESEEARARAAAWSSHLNAYLQAAGGVTGNESGGDLEAPPPRYRGDFEPDYFPQRDERFPNTWNFVFPPHTVSRHEKTTVAEKTLALMCKRALEMDVPEAMARMIGEAQDEPWDYYVDMCRQLWDEARHAMMGTIYFEHHGIDWRQQVGLHIGFSLKLNQQLTPLEAHAILYAIEQSLMPAKTGKRYEWEISKQADDPLATVFQDYDWADEVLHTQIGRRWLVSKLGGNREEVIALAQSKISNYADDLAHLGKDAPQVNWWPGFVRQVLNQEPTPIEEYEAVPSA
jgi:hypothetical protein